MKALTTLLKYVLCAVRLPHASPSSLSDIAFQPGVK
jgi:hypothetical protein